MAKTHFTLIFVTVLILSGSILFILWPRLTNPSDAYWNWCPNKTTSIKNHVNQKTYSSPSDIQRYCHIPYSTKKLPQSVSPEVPFTLFLSAKNEEGDQTYLELNESLELLRVNTRVFDSKPHKLQNLL